MATSSRRASAAARRKVQAALPSATAKQHGADSLPASILNALLADVEAAWQAPLTSETPSKARVDRIEDQPPSKAAKRRNRRNRPVGVDSCQQLGTDKGEQQQRASPPRSCPPASSLSSSVDEDMHRSLSNLYLSELFAEQSASSMSITSATPDTAERLPHSSELPITQLCQQTSLLSPMAPAFAGTVCAQPLGAAGVDFRRSPRVCAAPAPNQLSPGHSLPPLSSSFQSLSPLLANMRRDSEKLLHSYFSCDTSMAPSLIKDMLTSVRDTLLTGMDQLFSSLSSSVRAMADRTLLAELKLSEVIEAHNLLSETCNRMTEESNTIRNKIMALDDYNRRNNIKLRNIPESITTADLPTYVRNLLKHVLPQCPSRELVIDWVRRIPRPPHLPSTAHGDVIARVHYLHVKSAFMKATRRGDLMSEEYKDVSVYADLSPETLKHRRMFATTTGPLRNAGIQYKWLSSGRLLILRHHTKYIINEPEEGKRLLDSWSLV